MKVYYLFYLLLLFPLYFLGLIIYGLIYTFIGYIIDRKIIIECVKHDIKIILYVTDKKELETVMNLIAINNNINIYFVDSKIDNIENKIYNIKKLHRIKGPIIILVNKHKLDLIKLYQIIHIKKNRLKKIRKIKLKIDSINNCN